MNPSPKRSLADVGLAEVSLFAEALLMLSAASLVIKLPFRWVVRLMSGRGVERRADQARSEAVVVAVRRAARRLPWRTVCFDQGLAAQWMLRLRGFPSHLEYGIRTDGDAVTAHVWVTLDGRILIGEEEAERYASVATFPSRPS